MAPLKYHTEKYRSIFDKIDESKNNLLDKNEFFAAAKLVDPVGFKKQRSFYETLYKYIDTDGNGLDYNEFCFFLYIMSEIDNMEDIAEIVFRLFDRDLSGFLDAKEISVLLDRIGSPLDVDTVKAKIRETYSCDKVNCSQFRKLFNNYLSKVNF